MKIRTFTGIACLLFSTNLFAQDFMHSVGGSFNLLIHNVQVTTFEFSGTTIYTNIENKQESLFHGAADYFPRYNISQNEKSSVSIGLPLSLGLGRVNSGIDEGVYLATDISLGIYYNSGHKSSKQNESKFGYFIGGGFSYGYAGISSYYGSANISSYGPMLNAGIRFPISRKEDLSLGLFGRQGLEKSKFKTYGLKVMVDL